MAETEPVLVTAGILVNGDQILICQRHRSDSYGLQWEFPGGKVRDGEEMKSSLRRELTEELSIDAEVDRKSTRLNSSHGYISYAVFFFKKKKKKTSNSKSKINNMVRNKEKRRS